MTSVDRTADLFHDLILKPELARQAAEELARDTLRLAYQRHSETSRAAAELALPKAGTQRRRVYDFLVGCGPRGATDDEMQARLGMNPSTQRPRRIELVNAGLVAAKPIDLSIGPSICHRKTASGRDAVVWVAV